MAEVRLPGWFKEARGWTCPAGGKGASRGFAEKNLEGIASFLSGMFAAGGYCAGPGLMRSIEPRARMAGVVALVIACALTSRVAFLAIEFFVIAVIAALSSLGLFAVARRVLPTMVFTSVLIIPALFDFVTPGTDLFGVTLGGARVSITREGGATAVFFLARATAMVSLVSILALTTRQADLFRGLGGLKVPAIFVTALFMAFRYLLMLLKTAQDMSMARRSRMIGADSLSESQGWFSSRAALVLKKSMGLSGEVDMAMVSRGFTGKVKTFKGGSLSGRDYAWVGFTVFMLFLSFGL
ncbi:MAG: cobalt ECF transporter T component CbiQ [Deltaproteobacteria bacterium]|nr:cobalt ECF transporter T component CbiQ [Deltaproteobacteria bacterium]